MEEYSAYVDELVKYMNYQLNRHSRSVASACSKLAQKEFDGHKNNNGTLKTKKFFMTLKCLSEKETTFGNESKEIASVKDG